MAARPSCSRPSPGLSLGLLTGGADPPPPAAAAASGPAAIAIGVPAHPLVAVLLTNLVHPPIAVILDYYGLAFLLLVPLLFAPPIVLVLAGVIVVAIAPPVVAALQSECRLRQHPGRDRPVRAVADLRQLPGAHLAGLPAVRPARGPIGTGATAHPAAHDRDGRRSLRCSDTAPPRSCRESPRRRTRERWPRWSGRAGRHSP